MRAFSRRAFFLFCSIAGSRRTPCPASLCAAIVLFIRLQSDARSLPSPARSLPLPQRPPIFCDNCHGISSQLSRSCVSVVTIYCDNCHTSWTGDRETTATYWAKGQDTRNGRAAGSEQHGYKRNAGKYILLRKPKKNLVYLLNRQIMCIFAKPLHS